MTPTEHCLNCERTQAEVPLFSAQYQGSTLHICVECMPAFIHEREQVLAKWTAAQATREGRDAS